MIEQTADILETEPESAQNGLVHSASESKLSEGSATEEEVVGCVQRVVLGLEQSLASEDEDETGSS